MEPEAGLTAEEVGFDEDFADFPTDIDLPDDAGAGGDAGNDAEEAQQPAREPSADFGEEGPPVDDATTTGGAAETVVVKAEAADDEDDDDVVAVRKKDKKSKKEKKEKKSKKDKKDKRKRGGDEDDDGGDAKRVKLDREIASLEAGLDGDIDLDPSRHADTTQSLLSGSQHVDDGAAPRHTVPALRNERAKAAERLAQVQLAYSRQNDVKRQELDRAAYLSWKSANKKEVKELSARVAELDQQIHELSLENQQKREQVSREISGQGTLDKAISALQPIRTDPHKWDRQRASTAAKKIIFEMERARINDLEHMKRGEPAVEKIKLLPEVDRICNRAGFQQALVEAGLLKTLETWLHAPKGQLPTYQIRLIILRILLNLPYAGDPGRMRTIREAKDWEGITRDEIMRTMLGKYVRELAQSPHETQDNRKLANKLIEKWSRMIFNLSKNYRELAFQEKRTGRESHFKPDAFKMAADIPKYTKDGQRYYPDTNADGEPAAQRCRMPTTMMPDFVVRPAVGDVVPKMTTMAEQVIKRNLRAQRELTARDRAMYISIEGSSSTLKPEDASSYHINPIVRNRA